MYCIEDLKKKIWNLETIDKAEAMFLAQAPLKELCSAADEIRQKFCENAFDICTIINGKSGRCSEDCKYCAQSAYYPVKTESYPLMSSGELVSQAVYNEERGVLRYSIVTSGKRLSDEEIDQVCESIRQVKKASDIALCVSFGLLTEAQYRKIREAGATRVHNNLESSRRYFKEICTTHTYDEKIEALLAAKRAGLSICSGGIMGLGETMEDRIDMVLTLRELGVKSIPVNLLNPIPGTPFEGNKILSNDEMCRIVAVFRFLVPDASIRLAGGRGLLPDKGERCFSSGANAAISGDMLTTSGISIRKDMKLLEKLGYKAVLYHG